MLATLATRLERRVDALAGEALPLLGGYLDAARRRQAEHITFQLQNTWEQYVRSFVLVSATGRAIGSAGAIPPSVPQGHRSPEAACHLLVGSGGAFEPKWYRPLDAIRAARRLRVANLGNISAAIGSTPWPLEDLRLVRNFFAHRSRSSALEVRKLPWFATADVISVETTLMPFGPGGLRRFDLWCASMKVVSRAMV